MEFFAASWLSAAWLREPRRQSLKRDEHGARAFLHEKRRDRSWRSANAPAQRVTDSIFKQPHCLQTQLLDLAADFARVLPKRSRPTSEGTGNAGRLVRPQPRVVCSKHAR